MVLLTPYRALLVEDLLRDQQLPRRRISGALAVHSLNDQGDLQCHGQLGEVSCAFL